MSNMHGDPATMKRPAITGGLRPAEEPHPRSHALREPLCGRAAIALDVYRVGDAYELAAGLPGFRPDLIRVLVRQTSVEIVCLRSAVLPGDAPVLTLTLHAIQTLPGKVDPGAAQASLSGEVLRISLPMAAQTRRKRAWLRIAPAQMLG